MKDLQRVSVSRFISWMEKASSRLESDTTGQFQENGSIRAETLYRFRETVVARFLCVKFPGRSIKEYMYIDRSLLS